MGLEDKTHRYEDTEEYLNNVSSTNSELSTKAESLLRVLPFQGSNFRTNFKGKPTAISGVQYFYQIMTVCQNNKMSKCQSNPSQTPINPYKIFFAGLPTILVSFKSVFLIITQ